MQNDDEFIRDTIKRLSGSEDINLVLFRCDAVQNYLLPGAVLVEERV